MAVENHIVPALPPLDLVATTLNLPNDPAQVLVQDCCSGMLWMVIESEATTAPRARQTVR
jgi:hypothetical protein